MEKYIHENTGKFCRKNGEIQSWQAAKIAAYSFSSERLAQYMGFNICPICRARFFAYNCKICEMI